MRRSLPDDSSGRARSSGGSAGFGLPPQVSVKAQQLLQHHQHEVMQLKGLDGGTARPRGAQRNRHVLIAGACYGLHQYWYQVRVCGVFETKQVSALLAKRPIALELPDSAVARTEDPTKCDVPQKHLQMLAERNAQRLASTCSALQRHAATPLQAMAAACAHPFSIKACVNQSSMQEQPIHGSEHLGMPMCGATCME